MLRSIGKQSGQSVQTVQSMLDQLVYILVHRLE